MTMPQLPPQFQVLQMMMGHWVGQVTATVAQLGVPDQIAKGVHGSDELARACGANPDAMFRLLRAATSVGVLAQPEPRRFALTPLSECLRSDVAGSLRDLVIAELAPGHWLPWGHLADAVRSGKPVLEAALGCNIWEYYAKNTDEGTGFARGMGNLSTMVAGEVVGAFDFAHFGEIVDVGGSQGALLAAILRATPAAKGVLFDLPEVIAAGQKTVAGYGLGDRLRTMSGDFFGELPKGADAYLMKSVLHDWDDAKCQIILSAARRAAKPTSRLVLVEMLVSDSPMATPINLMDLNMLVLLGGRERTADEFAKLLGGAGWKIERVVPTLGLFAIIEASLA